MLPAPVLPTALPQIVIVDDGQAATIVTARAVRHTCPAPILVVATSDRVPDLDILASLPDLRITAAPGLTALERLNWAISETTPQDVVRVDPGISTLTPGWLGRLQHVARITPRAGCVAPKLMTLDGRVVSYGRRIVRVTGTRPHHANVGWQDSDTPPYSATVEVDAVGGAVVYLTRACLDDIGAYDTRFDPATSPTWIDQDDVCTRAWSRGWVSLVVGDVAASCDNTVFEVHAQQWSAGRHGLAQWLTIWGWDAEYPDLHTIRRRWGSTPVCRNIAASLRDNWPSDSPPVDILLTTKNRAHRLRTLLPRLGLTTYRHVTLYVFNDASTDDTAAVVEAAAPQLPFPVTLITAPASIGTHAGLNWLVAISHSPIIVRLDDEVTLDHDWLTQAVQTLRDHPFAGVVGGKLCAEELPDVIMNADTRWFPAVACHTGESDEGQCDYISRVSVIFGSCLVYRRAAVVRAGPFVTLEDDMHHVLLTQLAGYDALFDGRIRILHPNKPQPRLASRLITMRQEQLLETYGRDIYEILDTALDLAGRQVPGSRLDTDGNPAGLTAEQTNVSRMDPEAGLTRVAALRRDHRQTEARTCLDDLLRRWPDNPAIRRARAAWLLDHHALDAVRQDLPDGDITPDGIILRARLALAERRFDDAVALLGGAVGRTDPDAQAIRGTVAAARGEFEQAQTFLESALDAADPVMPAINLARLGHRAGRDDVVRRGLSMAFHADPFHQAAAALHRLYAPIDSRAARPPVSGSLARLDIVWLVPGLGDIPPDLPSAEAAELSGAAQVLANELSRRGHRIRVFSSGRREDRWPDTKRVSGFAAACVLEPPDVIICVRDGERIARQRFATLQWLWFTEPTSPGMLRLARSGECADAIDLWSPAAPWQVAGLQHHFPESAPRLATSLPLRPPRDHEEVVRWCSSWELALRNALAGEQALLERISTHVAAGRARVAGRILESEGRPTQIPEDAWAALERFVAWHAEGARLDPDDVALVVRSFGPLRRRFEADHLAKRR